MTKPQEKATLKVNGQIFEDWETIQVKQGMEENPPFWFRFTCSEGIPLVKNWAKLRIKPKDWVEVWLAGELAITGMVLTRQVFYDKQRHHIEIQGGTYAQIAAETGVVHKTGEFNNVTVEQVTRALLKPIKVPLSTVGNIPKHVFRRVSVGPGQFIYNAIERVARHVGAVITSNPQGHFVLANPADAQPGGDTLVEGRNILEGREIIQVPYASWSYSYGSTPGNDQKNMTKVAHEIYSNANVGQKVDQTISHGGLVGVLSEHPVWSQAQHDDRVKFERTTIDKDVVKVWITVQGWLKPSGGLWGPPMKTYSVWSPMLILDGVELMLKSALYTQDDQGGTRTVLELVNKLGWGPIPYQSNDQSQQPAPIKPGGWPGEDI